MTLPTFADLKSITKSDIANAPHVQAIASLVIAQQLQMLLAEVQSLRADVARIASNPGLSDRAGPAMPIALPPGHDR